MAKRRVVGKGVALHALVFVLANAALAFAWWWRGGGGSGGTGGGSGDYWPLGVHLVWGAALVVHWANDLIERTHRVR